MRFRIFSRSGAGRRIFCGVLSCVGKFGVWKGVKWVYLGFSGVDEWF